MKGPREKQASERRVVLLGILNGVFLEGDDETNTKRPDMSNLVNSVVTVVWGASPTTGGPAFRSAVRNPRSSRRAATAPAFNESHTD